MLRITPAWYVTSVAWWSSRSSWPHSSGKQLSIALERCFHTWIPELFRWTYMIKCSFIHICCSHKHIAAEGILLEMHSPDWKWEGGGVGTWVSKVCRRQHEMLKLALLCSLYDILKITDETPYCSEQKSGIQVRRKDKLSPAHRISLQCQLIKKNVADTRSECCRQFSHATASKQQSVLRSR